ncbi:hypothetical protein FJY90_00455 [Candidatus Gottesmanbacteria bacterium]|nr:hypothetical protein [Candidatus Gottesmanbacteria bacterium]
MDSTFNLDDFTQRLLPLTVLRRKAGEVLAKLQEVKVYVVTKDGKPVAKLSALNEPAVVETTKERLARLRSLIGGFRLRIGLTPRQLNKLIEESYEKMLPR